MAYEPTLTPRSDNAPGPRVDIVFNSLAATTATVTVYRLSDGVTAVVAGGTKQFAVGGYAITDYQAPGGVPLVYRAEQFNAAGATLGFTDSSSTQVDWDPSTGYYSDPLDPQSVVQVELKDDFGGNIKRRRQLELHHVGDRTVALMGQMGLIENMPLRCQTKTLAAATALDTVLRRSRILIRTMPPVRVPRILNVVIGEPSELDQDVQYGGEWVIWDLEGNETSPSVLDLIVPVITWQKYMDAFPTWAAFNAAYLTWFDAIKNPPGV